MKKLFIAEKPSVAKEFANALKVNTRQRDGYLEGDDVVVTWCVGHLVTMSYPDAYDPSLKKWSKETIPFCPEKYRYEVIPGVKKQYNIVAGLLNREDIDTIYVCTDSGREGEYIYRLVDQMANVSETKDRRRVWIDSQTEDEIRRGIQEAKPLSEYNNLSAAAYLRAKEDYLMGINFSRIVSIVYGYTVNQYIKGDKWVSLSVGRVMSCVLGMIVRREREIRDFVKTPFFRMIGDFRIEDKTFSAEWKAVEGSKYFNTPHLYKENGLKEKSEAEKFCEELAPERPATVTNLEKKKERKNAPLLFNLAELQNICSKLFKISPDQTLQITQELYEKKMVTYPRTDARVLSTAIAKEIYKNIEGLRSYDITSGYTNEILDKKMYQGIEKTKYVNDKQITDHYAIIPTGQGLRVLNSLSDTATKVYEVIVRRFLAIFYPQAVYQKVSITATIDETKESFFASTKVLLDAGFLPVTEFSFKKQKQEEEIEQEKEGEEDSEEIQSMSNEEFIIMLDNMKKGTSLILSGLRLKEGETSPPKRYNSGQMILAMENAGQLIEDEDLRSQIKGSGIGTSATRAEILKKLVNIEYIKLNKKTQIYTPTFTGEAVFEVLMASIKSMLNPELTASWELGLSQVSEGTITEEKYMEKLEGFVKRNVNYVKTNNYSNQLKGRLDLIKKNY